MIMQRYFLEVAYKGTAYSGFQVQQNANSIQAEVENALQILFRQTFTLTGSSRTDAGVHALQNFFHFDTDIAITKKNLYNLNSLLPQDIAAKNFFKVDEDAHCRFEAISREYKYFLYNTKDPFINQTAYYYPYKLNLELLRQAAQLLTTHTDFTAFSKRRTQVKHFLCNIHHSQWSRENDQLVYHVISNRFLRGMVRGLVATMLKVGRGLLSLEAFNQILENKNPYAADFSAPAHGLFLIGVNFKNGILKERV
jgi:tRNA pseudouridine38-40 synthase